jgi:glycosyltransferase involved in cell wall biosynthesis
MLGHLVAASWDWCTKIHVPLRFSERLADVGRFRPAKLLRLIGVAWTVWRHRMRGPIDVLFYPPCGPARTPFYRDVLLLLLVRPAAARVVFQFHAGGFDALRLLLTRPERRLALLAYGSPDTAIVLLPSLAGEVTWIEPRHVAVVPNGVEDHAADLRPASRTPVLQVLFVGALSERKGLRDLLNAVSILHEKAIAVRCTCVGAFLSETAAAGTEHQIRAAGIADQVNFTGELQGEEKCLAYAAAEVFCFPTIDTENQPLVLLEAMQFRLPVVTTRWRALPELVQDGETGFLVPPHDPQALAARLALLAGSPDLRRRLGDAARAAYLRRYTLQRHLQEMEQVLLSVAQRVPGTAQHE